MTVRSDINRTKTSETLRTKGRLTGNFGKPKVKANPGVIEVPKTALKKENLRIPTTQEYLRRIIFAYKTTNDPALKRTLNEIIKKQAAVHRR